MLFGDFLEKVTFSVVQDIRVIIKVSDWVMNDETLYDRIGIDENYITLAMLRYSVEKVYIEGGYVVIYLHDDSI